MTKYTMTFCGPSQSGNTQLFRRVVGQPYLDNQKFTPMQAVFVTYKVDQREIKIQYWDFPPSKLNTTERKNRQDKLRGMHKICITFDANDSNWQEKLDTYLRDNEEVFPVKLGADGRKELAIPVILVGTKVDLLSEQAKLALDVQAKAYAKNTWGIEHYIGVSAKTDYRLNELKTLIITDLPSLDDVAQHHDIQSKTTRRGPPIKRSSLKRPIPELTQMLKNGVSPGTVIEHLVSVDVSPEQKKHENNDNHLQAVSVNLSTLYSSSDPNGQTSPITQTSLVPTQGPAGGSEPKVSYLSFALRLAGMAIMLAALTSLVYLALVAASVFSAVALTVAVNSVVVTVGGLLGIAAPEVAFASACTTLGISTTAATTMIAAASTMLVGLAGYGVFRCGKPAASTQDTVNEQSVVP